jgi:CPA1 family monovalent cation:H+ antiporter
VRAAFDVLALLLVAVAVAVAASRLGRSTPLVLTAAGFALSYLPGVPTYPLDPEVVLVGILPPLLYATALRTPWVDLRRKKRSIALLSVGLVLVTALAVAWVAMLLLPGLPFPVALALGAVVSPPDAVAATAVARRVGMPRPVVTLLEGESLLNDATALVTLRTAVIAMTAALSLVDAAGDLVRAVVVGVLVGWLIAAVVGPVRRRLRDPVHDTALAVLIPYLAYLPAEALHGSGVLAVVVCGLLLGDRSASIQSAAARVTERVIWRSVQFLLEAVVFLLIGLQLQTLVRRAAASEVSNGRVVALCAAVLAMVIVVRIAWVFPALQLPPLIIRMVRGPDAVPPHSWRYTALVAWAGMRGVVTLAAAFTLPVALESRDVLIVVAFTVVAGTLLLQGATLPWLVRVLGVQGPDPAQDALSQAVITHRATQAGLRRLEEMASPDDPPETVEGLRSWSQRVADAAWERLGQADRPTPAWVFRRLRVGMLEAERDVLLEQRRTGALAHDVVAEVIERVDQEEAMLGTFAEQAPPSSTGTLTAARVEYCEHLQDAPTDTVPRTTQECEDCVLIGDRNWVHLRMCLACGHVACCDSSPNRHADRHYEAVGHPVMRSLELGEAWRWCYVDSLLG